VTPRFLAQSVCLDVGADRPLPSEFLLFRLGENASTKGSVWFDEVSALRVLADADTYANEYAIDLDHRMVKPRMVDLSNSDSDAMGWHRLAVRNGDLWAVSVSWTDEGARRLRSRSQRYTSPAFYTETLDDGRDLVVQYTNCAICARPATHGIMPLVATADTHALGLDRRTDAAYAPSSMSKDREALTAALASLDAGDATAAQSTIRAALEVPEDAPASEAAEAPADDAPPAEPEDEEYTRAVGELLTLTGAADLPGALRLLNARVCAATGTPDLRAASAFMSTVLRERSERETAEVRALVTELVSLRAETAATAFANGAPVARLLSEGLAGLRTRVAALRVAAPKAAEITPPPSNEFADLTPVELAQAEKITNPEARTRFIAVRRAKAEARTASQK
jgi:hypothetical protein